MVVSAFTTTSPESSSTIRSTPCVLGCCGPMLTVMVSDRSSGVVLVVIAIPGSYAGDLSKHHRRARRSGEDRLVSPDLLILLLPLGTTVAAKRTRRSQFTLHELADRMDQRAVRFLDSGGARVGHVDVDVGERTGGAAVAAGQRDGFQAARPGQAQALDDVRGAPARRDPDREVAAGAQGLDLPHEHPLEVVVVGHGRDHAG